MSTRANNYSDDDLTTDAIPSPPRDETKDKNIDEGHSEKEYTNTRPNITSSYKIPKSQGFTKPKKKTATAFASVINISNANGIHIGSNYNVYVNKTDNTQKNSYVVTDAIKTLFNSNLPVNRKHLTFISPHLNEQWRDTARALSYSDGQISQFYEDYIRSGIKEVIYQLLLDWIQNGADEATVGKLSNTLWETNQQDVVKRWSGYFKSDNQ